MFTLKILKRYGGSFVVGVNQYHTKNNTDKLKADLLNIMQHIKETRLPQRAYHIIRFAIRNLKLYPGQEVLEREMAAALEMSRTPLKEALVRLETEGMIKIIPRKGFIVESIEKDTLKEIYEIAESLDGLAVELATSKITEEELNHLKNLIKKQKESLQINDLKRWAALDDQFHTDIVEYSDNSRLNGVINIHADQLYRARLFTINKRPIPHHSIIEHQAIVTCMETQNGESAKLAMQSHRKRARSEILKVLNNTIS